MTGDISLLTNLHAIELCPITLPNGQLMWATKQGSLNVGKHLVLHRILYAPNLSITLISVALIIHDIDFVLFTKKLCVIHDQVSKLRLVQVKSVMESTTTLVKLGFKLVMLVD